MVFTDVFSEASAVGLGSSLPVCGPPVVTTELGRCVLINARLTRGSGAIWGVILEERELGNRALLRGRLREECLHY